MFLSKSYFLALEHVWVGGRTKQLNNKEWQWCDLNDKPLSRKGIGVGSTWCLGEENGSFPKAEPNSCLNLDREGHGFPLFYGLPCNTTQQPVICSSK